MVDLTVARTQCRLAIGSRVGRRACAKTGLGAGGRGLGSLPPCGAVCSHGERGAGGLPGRETWRGLPVTEAGFNLEPESVV